MAAPSTEKRELELVEKVDFRILNVANNEQKLQELLSKFLVPLLLKGGSEHASVRAKVATVAQRLKLFVQPPGIVLPVAALVKQFKATDSPVVRHLDIVFIQHSIGRLPVKERREILPELLKGISHVNTSTPALFDVVLQTLPVVKLPSRGSKEDGSFAADMGLGDPADANYVADRLGKLFLLSRPSPLATKEDVSFFFFDQENSWLRTGSNLADTRIRAANFLASGAFDDKSRFLPALYAAAHTDSRVSTIGEELLKRSQVSLESSELVEQLFQAHHVLPPKYRIRILNLLSRSALSTTYTDEILKVVQRNMDAGQTTASGAPPIFNVSARSRGLELAKLHKAQFEYINWIARVGPKKDDTSSIGRPLIRYLQAYIEGLGWPVPAQKGGHESVTLREKAYETVGMLAKGAQMTVAERLALVEWMFRSLTEDPTPEVVVNVDGALSSMTSMFPPGRAEADGTDGESTESIESIEPQIRSLLLKYINLSEDEPDIQRSARHAAAKWANNCLPFSDPTARWIDVLAAAGRRGERSDVVEEGHRGLDPWTYYSKNTESLVLPRWQELVQTFFKTPMARPEPAPAEEGEEAQPPAPAPAPAPAPPSNMDVDGVSLFVNFPGDKADAIALAVRYCWQILLLTALTDFKIEPGWEQRVDSLVRTDMKSRNTIRAYLQGPAGEEVVDLLTAAFEGMLKEQPAIAEPCGRCFVELASLSPKASLAPLASRAAELLPLVRSNKKEIRQLAAAAVGILGAHPANEEPSVQKLKSVLVEATRPWKTAVGSELNATEGSFVALAHLLSRLVYYGAHESSSSLVGDASALFPATDDIAEASASFHDAMFDALSQLWTAGVPCLPDGDGKPVTGLIDLLSTHAKKGNERAITALGRLAVAIGADTAPEDGGAALDVTGTILNKLFDLYETKQVEVHFTIGGAIAAAVAGWDSDVVKLSLDVEEGAGAAQRPSKRPRRLVAALDKMLADCKTTKPALLKASGIWLFSMIQYCSHLAEVQGRLRECQVAFMRLLSARDELVQETASRGLALVYDKGDAGVKGELVRDLVASFTGTGTGSSAHATLKVDEDTELFEAGALPTGDGKSVTSYRDIVSLANEVGDQSLIYKFMSLAANAATWSTRSAFGRFGLSSILSESEVDPRLYPKLFRYRFDPNPNVRRSMNDIWKALVADSNAVVDAHFDAIMQDLLASILGKEWRVREASSAALADLVQGRPFGQYERYYEEVWARALKVLDDVKGSVRQAALRLCMTLSNTLVRQMEDGGQGASATRMLNEALPFLLSDRGIESGVEDVKVFATVTVLKVAKHGGAALRPHIAALVPQLLGLLSTIEPQAINYYYMRSGEEDKEKLDKMRSAMVSQSPISEAIEDCLRSVDGGVMKELAPGLEAAMKSAVGMPTKLGCGRVIATLATRHAGDFAPYAGRFLQLLEKQALDRNDEVSQGYARAAAYAMRTAPDAARERFAARVVDLYLGAEDEARRQKVADVVLALAKISPDHFHAVEAQLLPLAFVGSHDGDEYVGKACAEVWSKHAGSSLSVSRYVPEIAALVRRALDTAQWALKHAGARAAADAVRAVLGASDLSGQVNVAHLAALWPLYEKALALKTFAGKEQLLEVLPDFVAKGAALWRGDGNAATAAALRKIAVVEAKRNNAAYRVHALRCLWRVAAERDDVDMWADVVAVAVPHLEAWGERATQSGDGMDVDGGSRKGGDTEEQVARQTAEGALDAVARGYSRRALQADPPAVLRAVWTTLAPFLQSDAYALVRRVTWYKAAADLLEAAAEEGKAAAADGGSDGGSDGDLVLSYLGSFDADQSEAGTEEQRSTRAKALKALARAAQAGAFGGQRAAAGEALARIATAVEAALATERSLEVQKQLKEALKEARRV